MRTLRAFAAYLVFGLVLLTQSGPSGLVRAEGPAEFRFWRDVVRPPAKEEEILSFTLDSDMYAAMRDGLPDLRILDENDAGAPYQIEPDVEFREERTRHTGSLEVVSLREEGNAIEVRVRLPKDAPAAEGFQFFTPQVDFERKVKVFGSTDGAAWTLVVNNAMIFDYSRYMDVSQRDVALPSQGPQAGYRFREFKLSIEDVTDEMESPYKHLTRTFRGGKEEERKESTSVERRVFRIDRIAYFRHTTQQHVKKSRTAAYPVAGFEKEEDARKQETILHVRTRREPLTSFTLQTPSRNFYRRAAVQVPEVHGVNTEWRTVGSVTLSNFRFRSLRREQLTVAFPEQRREEYRIVISNEDNRPLDIQGVKAEGNVYRAVFLAEEGKRYRVFYGSEGAERPKYEAATVLATLRESFQPTPVTLAAQVDNASYGGEPGLTLHNVLNNWVFLGAVIGLMVVVLAWGLFHAGRQLEDLPKDNSGKGSVRE